MDVVDVETLNSCFISYFKAHVFVQISIRVTTKLVWIKSNTREISMLKLETSMTFAGPCLNTGTLVIRNQLYVLSLGDN